MSKFFGKFSILVGSIIFLILSFISVGFLIYDLITNRLGSLTQSVFLNGWIALLFIIFNAFFSFLIALFLFKNVSSNQSTNNCLVGLIFLLIFFIISNIFIFSSFNEFEQLGLYIGTTITKYFGFFFAISGSFLNKN